MEQAGEALYVDLLRVYGVDLVLAIRSGYPSPRLLLSLIQNLPQGSLFQAVLLGDSSAFGFSREVSTLADVYDSVMTNMVGTAMGKMRKRPDPYPRPYKRVRVPRKMSIRELAGAMGVPVLGDD